MVRIGVAQEDVPIWCLILACALVASAVGDVGSE